MNASLPDRELERLWEKHTEFEFVARDAAATVATMTTDNYVNHVPTMTGGHGRAEMLEFYGKYFIPQMPADTTLRLLARTIGQNRLIDEFVLCFTHDVEMAWMLPGIAPTFRKVEVPTVVVVEFAGEKISCERIYWDQASVLVQIGLIDPSQLPVAGVETARKFEDSRLPSNTLIHRAEGRKL